MRFFVNLLIVAIAFDMTLCENKMEISQDFLVKLNFFVKESNIPNYIIHHIYGHSSENNITTRDILNLYSTSQLNFKTVENILEQLGIENSQVFSTEGLNYTLDLFNITFSKFYNTIIDDLEVRSKQESFLPLLQIDQSKFFSALISGGDSWAEFSKGNFTRENIDAVVQITGVTLENIWANMMKQFSSHLISYEVEVFVDLLKNCGVEESKALVIWRTVPISTQQVYNVPIFDSIIKQSLERANNLSVYGSIIGERELIIHRNVYDQFCYDQDILTITATTIDSKTNLVIDSINGTVYRSFMLFYYTTSAEITSLVIVNIAESNTDLVNCSYVMPFSDEVKILWVPSATYNKDYTYSIPLIVDPFLIGGALVCNHTLYGLGREAVESEILVDAFAVYEPPNSEANSLYCWMGLFALVIIHFTV